MEMQDMMKPMMAIMMAALMFSLIPALPVAAAPANCCPIHARLGDPICFDTLAQLEVHFTSEHPSVPIDIDWE